MADFGGTVSGAKRLPLLGFVKWLCCYEPSQSNEEFERPPSYAELPHFFSHHPVRLCNVLNEFLNQERIQLFVLLLRVNILMRRPV
jgi:hypothetical protein